MRKLLTIPEILERRGEVVRAVDNTWRDGHGRVKIQWKVYTDEGLFRCEKVWLENVTYTDDGILGTICGMPARMDWERVERFDKAEYAVLCGQGILITRSWPGTDEDTVLKTAGV